MPRVINSIYTNLATVARLLGPGGARSIVAESLKVLRSHPVAGELLFCPYFLRISLPATIFKNIVRMR
jgi:hypothetical protein